MSPDGFTKPLPEEKLLKLIRDKGPRAAASTSLAAMGTLPHVMSARDAGGNGSGFRWTAIAAGGLGVVLLVEAVCLIMQLIRPMPRVHTPVIASRSATQGSSNLTLALPDLPSLSHSAPDTLFISTTTSNGTSTSAKPRGAPTEIAKLLAARLTLMGIVAGNPAQAIIEDAQTKKTYFVTAGQVVVEGAVLEQVLDNRVILDLDGEKIEIML